MTSPDKTTTDVARTSRNRKTPGISPDVSASKITRARRENVREKAERLLKERRLRIVKVDGNLIVAECRGDSGGIYHLGFRPDRMRWGCTCPAMGPCSHLIALQSVTAVER